MAFTCAAMFLLGVARARVTEAWWTSAIETLALGALVAAAAFGAGAAVAALIGAL